jgi:hypothetical protein
VDLKNVIKSRFNKNNSYVVEVDRGVLKRWDFNLFLRKKLPARTR